MSGESTTRAAMDTAAFEKAFGDTARCNRCLAGIPDYRVIATFLHDTVAVRAYCPGCYPSAVEGEYHAFGDGLVLDYPGYAARFGPAGPPPPPCTPVDRMLTALIREPALRSLAPASEVLARRALTTPYRFRVELHLEGATETAQLLVAPEGKILAVDGDPAAVSRLRAVLTF